MRRGYAIKLRRLRLAGGASREPHVGRSVCTVDTCCHARVVAAWFSTEYVTAPRVVLQNSVSRAIHYVRVTRTVQMHNVRVKTTLAVVNR